MEARPILLVEDDPSIGSLLSDHLERIPLAVEWHSNGTTAWNRFQCQPFGLALLDVVVPGLDGFELCRRIRSVDRLIPIIMITARSSLDDVVRGLELGADDYVVKPFRLQELAARLQSSLRRASVAREPGTTEAGDEAILRTGSLELDLERREARLEGRCIPLTAKEAGLLSFFMRHPGRVFRRDELLDAVWGPGFDGFDHTVNTHLNRLRNKIERDPGNAQTIVTVWGAGYRFEPPS